MTREEAYDRDIAPLMEKVIAFCNEHKIPMLCDFALDDDLKCTSALLPDEWEPPDSMVRALGLLYQKPTTSSALKITTFDKDGKPINQTVVLG